MSTTEVGRQAEELAAKVLKKRGYKILDQNWRTRWCEIDIVAQRLQTVYFIEVKYRKNNTWGDGLDAITNKKLQQMAFSAEFWVSQNKWLGDYELMAASVSGEPLKLDDLMLI